LIQVYKDGLNERKINLDDDYIKFIRYASHFVEKNGQGVVAMITNNSFIDGITHRQMRHHIMSTFEKLYVLDLHGNSKKQEKTPDGGKDENVFDIMQGVSISLFVKTGKVEKKIFHSELFGTREFKYNYLLSNDIFSMKWAEIVPQAPYYFFEPFDVSEKVEYETGIRLDELFLENNTGIQTKRDKLVYQFTKKEIQTVSNDLLHLDTEYLRALYSLPKDGRDWTINSAIDDIRFNNPQIIQVHYHPFDIRFTLFSGKTKGFMAYPRAPIMRSMIFPNVALLAVRNSRRGNVNSYFVTDKIVDKDAVSPFDNAKFFPLYIYHDESLQLGEENVTLNLKTEAVRKLLDPLECRLTFNPKNLLQTGSNKIINPLDLLDYIYSILYSYNYRTKYESLLQVELPRIPIPKDLNVFWSRVSLGRALRMVHLMTSPAIDNIFTTYPKNGSNTVEKPKFDTGRIWINDNQYFEGVSETIWNFYIGGYQPAQKWLKDRIGRTLTHEDIFHFQKIIVALAETDRIMKELKKIPF
jgi:predicted helicase